MCSLTPYLLRSNNQGELSPLEIGIHALEAVPPSEGGRGESGGLSEYAKNIGKAESSIRWYRDAARVGQNFAHVCEVLDKTRHLAAIGKAPESEWQYLTEQLIEQDWSAKKTESVVELFLGNTAVLEAVAKPRYTWIFPRGGSKIYFAGVLETSLKPPSNQFFINLEENSPNLEFEFLRRCVKSVRGCIQSPSKGINSSPVRNWKGCRMRYYKCSAERDRLLPILDIYC